MKHAEQGICQNWNISHTAVFASLSNKTRLRCLYLTAIHDEVCVCEVVDALEIPQPTVSKAFKSLKDAGLVSDRRDANWTYYRLNDGAPEWVSEIIDSTVEDLATAAPYLEDENRFSESGVRNKEIC